MIVVKIELHSAVTSKVSSIGTLVIDNIGGTKNKGNYRCRMYRKNQDDIYLRLVKGERPIRECEVLGHPRLTQPVQSLVFKALEKMNYGLKSY